MKSSAITSLVVMGFTTFASHAQSPELVSESEPQYSSGFNDSYSTSQTLTTLGISPGDSQFVRLSGSMAPPPLTTVVSPNAEDDGTLATAKALPIQSIGNASVVISSEIGNGPWGSSEPQVIDLTSEDDGSIGSAHSGFGGYVTATEFAQIGDGPYGSGGTGSGDFDFYRISLNGATKVTVRVEALDEQFKPLVLRYGESGFFYGANSDGGSGQINFTSYFPPDWTSPLVLAVAGNREDGDISDDGPSDPFDSSSGPGAGSEGAYAITATFFPPGDFDMFAFYASAYDNFIFEVDTDAYGSTSWSPSIGIFDGNGNFVEADNNGGGRGNNSFDAYLNFIPTESGNYYAVIGGGNPGGITGLQDLFPDDLNDPRSGPGVATEGQYDFYVSKFYDDVDTFAVELEANTVLGLGLEGSADLIDLASGAGIVNYSGMQSTLDVISVAPADSPLPRGGTASVAVVIPETGTYYVTVAKGVGDYTLDLKAMPPPQSVSGIVQKLFIDFDGATLDATVFDPAANPNAVLSPLSDFIADFGLQANEEDAVIDRALETIARFIGPEQSFINAEFGIEILNSRDHADRFGQPNVSRVIVGGTNAEAGFDNLLNTAESIDVGNFNLSEQAVVLLDILSSPSPVPWSLNRIPLDPGVTRAELVGEALGRSVVHVATKLFGLFKTYPGLPNREITDRFSDLETLLSVGPDGIFGSPDDYYMFLLADNYDFGAGIYGVQRTLHTLHRSLYRESPRNRCSAGPAPFVCWLGGASTEALAASPAGASLSMQVRNGSDGSLMNVVDFGSDPALAIEAIEDLSGNGEPELAVLGTRPSGQVRVQIKDSMDGFDIDKLFFGDRFAAVDMVVAPDTDGNGAPEIVVLGKDASGGVRAQARDVLSGLVTSTTYFGAKSTPVDLQLVPDVSGNGYPEIAMLGVIAATGQVRVQLRDLVTGEFLRNIFFGAVYEPLQLLTVPDMDGDRVKDLAELARRADTGAARVQIKSPVDGSTISTAYLGVGGQPRQIAVTGDTNLNGFFDIAVLTEDQAGRGKVVVRDGATGDFVSNIFFSATEPALGLVRFGDVDLSTDDELAVVGAAPGFNRVQVRDSFAGHAVATIDLQ